jgi:hypothetical protein
MCMFLHVCVCVCACVPVHILYLNARAGDIHECRRWDVSRFTCMGSVMCAYIHVRAYSHICAWVLMYLRVSIFMCLFVHYTYE